jgi:hypothetical protein
MASASVGRSPQRRRSREMANYVFEIGGAVDVYEAIAM